MTAAWLVQLAAGTAHLLNEHAAGVAERLERLGLPTAAIEREHPLGAQVLAQRKLDDECVALGHDVGVTAEREVGLDAALEPSVRAASSRAISDWAKGS